MFAMAISPLSPLKKKAKQRITKKDENLAESKNVESKRCFANAQHDNGHFYKYAIFRHCEAIAEAINRI